MNQYLKKIIDKRISEIQDELHRINLNIHTLEEELPKVDVISIKYPNIIEEVGVLFIKKSKLIREKISLINECNRLKKQHKIED